MHTVKAPSVELAGDGRGDLLGSNSESTSSKSCVCESINPAACDSKFPEVLKNNSKLISARHWARLKFIAYIPYEERSPRN